jgi:hypothetical protein
MNQNFIHGFKGINNFVADVLRRENLGIHLDVFPGHGDWDWDNYNSDQELPVCIDRASMQFITEKFIRQFQEDREQLFVAESYKRKIEELMEGLDRQPELHFTPNALSLLLYGIREFSYGLSQEQEKQLENISNQIIVKAARDYAWEYYWPRGRNDLNYHYEDKVEFISPKDENILHGLSNIQSQIERDLRAGGDFNLLNCFSLAVLKPASVIEINHSLLPSTYVEDNQNQPLIWSVKNSVLKKVFDTCVDIIRGDVATHAPFFDKMPVSPAARALLLYGMEYSRRDIYKDEKVEFMDAFHTSLFGYGPIDKVILTDAELYAKSIYNRAPTHEIIRQSHFTPLATAGRTLKLR